MAIKEKFFKVDHNGFGKMGDYFSNHLRDYQGREICLSVKLMFIKYSGIVFQIADKPENEM